jgi:hypothetical protein
MAEYLTRKQATVYLRKKGLHITDSHLGWGARVGTGPQFRYLGTHPVYTEADLDAWIETRRKAGGRLEAFLQIKRLRLGPLTRTSTQRRPRKLREQAREERA